MHAIEILLENTFYTRMHARTHTSSKLSRIAHTFARFSAIKITNTTTIEYELLSNFITSAVRGLQFINNFGSKMKGMAEKKENISEADRALCV